MSETIIDRAISVDRLNTFESHPASLDGLGIIDRSAATKFNREDQTYYYQLANKLGEIARNPRHNYSRYATIASLQHCYAKAQAAGGGEIFNHSLAAVFERFGTPPSMAFTEAALSHYGFGNDETEKLQTAWQVATGEGYSYEGYALDNMRVVAGLEAKAPGAATELMERFRIKNFGRLPVKAWLRQFDHRDDCSHPFGIGLLATSDWNTAFRNGRIDYLPMLADDLALLGHGFRIYECDSTVPGARALIEASCKYRQPISCIVSAQHGDKNGSLFGDWESREGVMSISDWLSKGPKEWSKYDEITRDGLRYLSKLPVAGRIRRLFADGATGAFNSCLTGVKDGVAEAAADLLGIPITAPTISQGITGITVTPNREGIKLNVSYPNMNEQRTIQPR